MRDEDCRFCRARRTRSSWLPRTQEADIEMARSTTSEEEGPLDMMSPAKIMWSLCLS